MSLASLLMAGLLTFVLLVPTLMVAVLVSGLSRRTADGAADSYDGAEPTEVGVAV